MPFRHPKIPPLWFGISNRNGPGPVPEFGEEDIRLRGVLL
jgi:hypothetical protein